MNVDVSTKPVPDTGICVSDTTTPLTVGDAIKLPAPVLATDTDTQIVRPVEFGKVVPREWVPVTFCHVCPLPTGVSAVGTLVSAVKLVMSALTPEAAAPNAVRAAALLLLSVPSKSERKSRKLPSAVFICEVTGKALPSRMLRAGRRAMFNILG